VCTDIVNTCSGTPTDLTNCETYLSANAACAAVQECLVCAGSSPTVNCGDAGHFTIVGCPICDSFDSCSDGGSGGDAGGGDSGGGAGCSGANNVAMSGGSPGSPTIVPTSGLSTPVAIWGPSYGEPNGFFELTGLPPGAGLMLQMVYGSCSQSGCPNDISFSVGTLDGGSPTVVQSSGSTCGSSVIFTDSTGTLLVSVGKTGDAGAEPGVGLEIFLEPWPDAGATCASSGGDDSCDTCTKTSCCSDLAGCLADPGCTSDYGNFETCRKQDGGSPGSCEASFGSGGTAQSHLAACLVGACGTSGTDAGDVCGF
jgi:hypothetical protein